MAKVGNLRDFFITLDAERRCRLVLLGFHRLASSILYDLERTYPDLMPEVLVVDFNVEIHNRIRTRGV